MWGQIEFALNYKTSDTTKFCPAKLMFGQKLIHPIDLVLGT